MDIKISYLTEGKLTTFNSSSIVYIKEEDMIESYNFHGFLDQICAISMGLADG